MVEETARYTCRPCKLDCFLQAGLAGSNIACKTSTNPSTGKTHACRTNKACLSTPIDCLVSMLLLNTQRLSTTEHKWP